MYFMNPLKPGVKNFIATGGLNSLLLKFSLEQPKEKSRQ